MLTTEGSSSSLRVAAVAVLRDLLATPSVELAYSQGVLVAASPVVPKTSQSEASVKQQGWPYFPNLPSGLSSELLALLEQWARRKGYRPALSRGSEWFWLGHGRLRHGIVVHGCSGGGWSLLQPRTYGP